MYFSLYPVVVKIHVMRCSLRAQGGREEEGMWRREREHILASHLLFIIMIF
jgi:hypothetical protein